MTINQPPFGTPRSADDPRTVIDFRGEKKRQRKLVVLGIAKLACLKLAFLVAYALAAFVLVKLIGAVEGWRWAKDIGFPAVFFGTVLADLFQTLGKDS